jgi:predicted HAD superfamily phosphohydrolase
MDNIDDMIRDQVDSEDRWHGESRAESLESQDAMAEKRVLVGKVERFFSRINVMALHLEGSLKVGDTIEVESGGSPVRIVVSSMQIDKQDVSGASGGDSVGIKVDNPVREGSSVYLVR